MGSVPRYFLDTWTQTLAKSIGFPYGILAVNLIECFMIGFLSQLAEARGSFTPESEAFIGILGGFTTFFSFGNDTITLLRHSRTFMLWQMLLQMLYWGLHLSGLDERPPICSGLKIAAEGRLTLQNFRRFYF